MYFVCVYARNSVTYIVVLKKADFYIFSMRYIVSLW